MKNILITLSFILSFPLGLQSQDYVTTNFVSLTVPQDYKGEIRYLNETKTVDEVDVSSVPHDSSILPSFPNLLSTVTLYDVTDEGSLQLLGNSLSGKKSTYIVIYDFSQTQTLEILDADKSAAYFALVGVSVRMVARVTTKSADINLADLFGLGIAASRNKVSGSLEVRVSGINSQQINEIIPVTTDLSPSSISNALQAVATIKSHIYAPDTCITPQFLAFSAVKSDGNELDVSVEEIFNKVKTYNF